MHLSVRFLKLPVLAFLAAIGFSSLATAQDAATKPLSLDNPPNAIAPEVGVSEADRQQQIMKSMEYMLRRAQLTRTLAAEHLQYIKKNRDKAEVRLMEDASQVMAFDLICEDEKMDGRALNQIAADTSFKIAMMAGRSTIGARLTKLAAKQTIEERMELIGDIATTVLMFEVGRRRGLFDALLTDFGKKRFCAGMQTDMRTRYNEIIAGLGD